MGGGSRGGDPQRAATARAQGAPDADPSFELDSAVLYYKENAGRVQAIEPVVSLKKDFGDQRVLAGAFMDNAGLFNGIADRDRVTILLDLLGRKVRVLLDADLVAAA